MLGQREETESDHRDLQEAEDAMFPGTISRSARLAPALTSASAADSESGAQRTSALGTMRRRRRRKRWWRRRWAWYQRGGTTAAANNEDGKGRPPQPTREGVKKFRAAVKTFRPRYFKWIEDVAQMGRQSCTFDNIDEAIIEGDSLDSKGGDSKDGDSKDGDGGGNKDNIFDRPAGKGKGKGYNAGRDRDDESDDFAIKGSKGSKGSKLVRKFCVSRPLPENVYAVLCDSHLH